MNAPISAKDLVLTQDKKDWFVADRFGMFIHWGLYSLGARHEWLKNREEIDDRGLRRSTSRTSTPISMIRGNGRAAPARPA